ncbi:PilT/PilU family type 4a pilus ATPase [bacterium]|nr:PilT/PilU family type 4a pilus ATPase [bacterium]
MKSMSSTPELASKIAIALSRCALFRGLDQKLLADISTKGTLIQADPGEFLTEEGNTSDAFYVLLNGQASVMIQQKEKKEDVEIAQLGPGDTAGEIALLLSQPYGASVKATNRVVAARYDAKFFEKMVEEIPAFGLLVAKAIGKRFQQLVRLIPVPEYDSAEGNPSEQALQLLPIEFIRRHRVLPIKKDGNVLTIGFVDEPSGSVMQSLRGILTGVELRPVRIDSAVFDGAMRSHSGSAEKSQLLAPTQQTASTTGPISLTGLLKSMVAEGASDLHLSAGQRPRWRIDGQMQEIVDAPLLTSNTVLELLTPVIDGRFKTQFEETNDVDFAYALGEGARFRVNLFRNANGSSAVFRHIPVAIPNLEQLGMPETVKRFCNEPKGLILVTGPTGSGKSTTLAAMVDLLNKSRRDHIITLEDPIEFVHPSKLALINQREVGVHTQSFSRALRAALREDPDIVLVGEMRDLETISMALETANTGHLVLGTLHTSTAVMTVDRIVNLFPAEQQNQIRSTLADVLRGVICQNLCRRIGGGRVAALEILVVNPAVASLIREGKTIQIPNIMQTGKALGNLLLNDSLINLVQTQKVEYEEALSKAVDKKDVAQRLKRTL